MLETAQEWNIFDLIYGLNFYDPPRRIERSVLELVTSHPAKSIAAYAGALSRLLIYVWPALFGALFCRPGVRSRFCIFAALSVVLYALPTALGGSSRAPLVIVVLYAVPLVMLAVSAARHVSAGAAALTRAQRWALYVPIVVVLGFGGAEWVYKDVYVLREYRQDVRTFSEVESLLETHGMRKSSQVFTSNFDLYFRDAEGYRPRYAGGASRYSLWGYDEENPRLSFDSPDAFLSDCREQGIRYLVLTPTSERVSPFLGALYADGTADGMEGVTGRGEVSDHRVFVLEERPPAGG